MTPMPETEKETTGAATETETAVYGAAFLFEFEAHDQEEAEQFFETMRLVCQLGIQGAIANEDPSLKLLMWDARAPMRHR